MDAEIHGAHTEPDIDYVLVDFEPLHKQRWRTNTLRLVCAEFPPYTTCKWHQHLKYGIYVVMAPLDVIEQPYGQQPRPLVQEKGAVFCRDHTKDKLIHIATTRELPAFLIEIELLKEKADIIPNGQLPLHAGAGIELLADEPECRVYRIILHVKDYASPALSLNLPTEAVLLALDDCEAQVTTTINDEEITYSVSLKIGGDVHMSPGACTVKVVSASVEKMHFVLAEVY